MLPGVVAGTAPRDDALDNISYSIPLAACS